MNIKNVEIVIAPPEPHMVGDGFKVHNFIPSGPRMDIQRMDPFLVLDYNAKMHVPPSKIPRGVGVHPHKGFETVTIAYKGSIAHNDSSGGGGVIGEGDVQWMTAANGVLHKEFHEEEFSKKGGEFQMVQLWVNLSAENKKVDPKYQAIKADDIAKYELADGAGAVEVIAGEYKGVKGPASTHSPVHLYNLRLKTGAKLNFSFPAEYNTALLAVEGRVMINEEDVPADYFAVMDNDGEDFTVRAEEDSLILLISGEPLNEPIAAHGPFVMNDMKEVVQAFNDFNSGKFGYLE